MHILLTDSFPRNIIDINVHHINNLLFKYNVQHNAHVYKKIVEIDVFIEPRKRDKPFNLINYLNLIS